jgi:hypothetical protein
MTPGELHDRKSPESMTSARTPGELHDRKSPESRATADNGTSNFSICVSHELSIDYLFDVSLDFSIEISLSFKRLIKHQMIIS